MLYFTAEVLGVEVLNRAFNRIDQHVSDLRSVWPDVAAEFYAIEHSAFESEGGTTSAGRWAPLSPAYAKFKAIAFPGQPILRATTSLYESMTSPDAADSIYRVEPLQLTIGSKREGAIYHQRGTRRMPARPIIALTGEDKRRIQKAIQRGLVPIIRAAGFQVDERAA